jgi:hypothetical protein
VGAAVGAAVGLPVNDRFHKPNVSCVTLHGGSSMPHTRVPFLIPLVQQPRGPSQPAPPHWLQVLLQQTELIFPAPTIDALLSHS